MARSVFLALNALLLTTWMPTSVLAAHWQYRISLERGPDRRGRLREPGDVLLWLPPESQAIRAVFLCGSLGIENELVIDPQVREVCRQHHIAIVYFSPHLSGVFHYWEKGNTDGERLLKAIEELAAISGYPELRDAPWITAGHSTAGIFARNVGYWKPRRTASIVHLKSGNFHQREHLPPQGSLAGIPLLAINGQFESYGPEGGIRPEFGRETQWRCARTDLQTLRRSDPGHLVTLTVQPGADHFHGAAEIASIVALFIKKTAEFRLRKGTLQSGAEMACVPIPTDSGWLMDPDLDKPKHVAAPLRKYSGNSADAFWVYDGEMASAIAELHRNLGLHQALSPPECTWLDKDPGWEFRVSARSLDRMPDSYGGRVGGLPVGYSNQSILYRAKPNEPVEQIGPDRFRLIRQAKHIHIAAFRGFDERHRSTIRWSRIEVPQTKSAAKQTIQWAPIPDIPADAESVRLRASSPSGLPVHYEVDYGPIIIVGDQLSLSEIPRKVKYPMACQITAYQMGRRTAPAISSAESVTKTVRIVRR